MDTNTKEVIEYVAMLIFFAVLCIVWLFSYDD